MSENPDTGNGKDLGKEKLPILSVFRIILSGKLLETRDSLPVVSSLEVR